MMRLSCKDTLPPSFLLLIFCHFNEIEKSIHGFPDPPAEGVEEVSADLPDGRQGECCKPVQVGGEAGEEDKVEEKEVDDHVADHVQLGEDQPLELPGKGGLPPPRSREDEADGDADGEKASRGGNHRGHWSWSREVQHKDPGHPLYTPKKNKN